MQWTLPKLMPRLALLKRITGELAALAEDKAWTIEVKELKAVRSQQQNRYLWGCVYPEIAKHLPGWEAEDIHEYCLGECFGWEMMEGLGKKRLRPLKRSARLGKMEFVDFVAFIQRRMAEHGIVVPDPDPEWFLHEPETASAGADVSDPATGVQP
jgi:hypothetical protein